MPPIEVLLFRLFLVIIIGGLIGAEREFRSKSAGFRTMILICLGSFLFTLFSLHITKDTPDRIASNIVTGIGFLGAGVIFQSDNRINGLTTAATIWATAAIGMGIGGGYYKEVLWATALILISLLVLTRLEYQIDKVNQSRIYKIVSPYKEDLLQEYEELFKEHHLSFKRLKQTKQNKDIAGTWIVQGSEKNHNLFIKNILQNPTVKEFEF